MIFVVLAEKVLSAVECNLETKGQKYIINTCIGEIKKTDKQTVYFPLVFSIFVLWAAARICSLPALWVFF